MVGSIGLQGLTVIAGIIIARILGKRAYGQWGIIMSTAMMFGSLGGLGMATAAAKYVAELKNNDPLKAGRVLSLILCAGLAGVLLTSIACFGFAGLMAYRLYNAAELYVPLRANSIMLFFLMGSLILQGVMAGFEDFRGIARVNMIQGCTLFVVIVLLTYLLGLLGAVIAMAASYFTAVCFYMVTIVKKCREHGIRISGQGIWKESRVLWHYSAPGFLTSSVLHPTRLFSHAMVANTKGGFSGLGGYNAAERWQSLVLFMPRAVKRITLPMLSRLQGDKDYKRLKKALWANIALNGGLALMVALPIMVLSPWILRLYGPDFTQDWDILIILVGLGVFQSLIEVLSQVLACMEKMWYNFGFHVVYGAIILGGSYLLVPHYGVRGYLWAYALAVAVHMLNHIVAAVVILTARGNSMNSELLMNKTSLPEQQ
jgi:O-antigen/teichoic acid export membrane protein